MNYKEINKMINEEVNKIFQYAIEEHGDWIKDYMYMYTEDNKHYFKNKITRRYVSINKEQTK